MVPTAIVALRSLPAAGFLAKAGHHIVNTPEKRIELSVVVQCNKHISKIVLFEAFEPLVPLSFDITVFTPVAYLRHSL